MNEEKNEELSQSIKSESYIKSKNYINSKKICLREEVRSLVTDMSPKGEKNSTQELRRIIISQGKVFLRNHLQKIQNGQRQNQHPTLDPKQAHQI